MSLKKGMRWSLFLLPWLFSAVLHGQGYRIEVSMAGLNRDTLILGEYFTTRMVPLDTILLDEKGTGTFTGEEPLVGGMYLVYIDPGHYFDMLIGDDQELKLFADTSDLNGTLRFEGSEDNRIFLEYKGFLQQKREELQQYQSEMAMATEAEQNQILEKQKSINREMEAYMDGIQARHPDLFVSEFIGATREPVPPEEMLTGDRRTDDSLRYFYYREHYFDRFDPFNVRLLHTPLYESKVMNYITRAVPQHPDSLTVAVDFLLGGARGNEELYRYLLITLFNHFAESKYMGMDVVYFHIAEQYYLPDATWSSEEFLAKLEENLEKNKPTLIGKTAPNVVMREIPPEHFAMAMQDTAIKRDPHIGQDFFINSVDADFTILYFWEADCSHCQKTTPELHEVYERLKDKNVKVIAVHVINSIEGKEKWIDFVNEHDMEDWINCWSPYSNDFRKIYNLQSYPQLFILDRDKKIVAKRVTPEQAEKIIDNLIEAESNNNT
ncbi:MAG: thioredoxin-like domain-containing protein [Bacteroidales bacterium]